VIGENPSLFGFDFEPLSLRESIIETDETEPSS
jgi:hypothetical protein